jgi:predicted dehydrogenase
MTGLRVAIVGCGLIGGKRASALRPGDTLVACCDTSIAAADALAACHGCKACASFEDLLDTKPDVVIVATVHDRLAELAELSLRAGAHVLVEKPAGVSTSQVDRVIAASLESQRLVKVGFNHRFHPGIARAAEEVHSGQHGAHAPARALRSRWSFRLRA